MYFPSYAQGRIQKMWLGGEWRRLRRGRALKALVELSAVGAKIEAPRGWGVPSPPGEGSALARGADAEGVARGLCPLPRNYFRLLSELKKASFSAFWDWQNILLIELASRFFGQQPSRGRSDQPRRQMEWLQTAMSQKVNDCAIR